MAEARPQPPNGALQKKAPSATEKMKEFLQRCAPELRNALPEGVNAKQFIRIALTEFNRVPGLQECDPRSFIGAVFQAAQLGLTIDSTLGHAYLVPYKGMATLIPGYKGFIQLAFRSGLVTNIYAQVVRRQDEFDWSEGTTPKIHHKRKLLTKIQADETADVIAVYSVAMLKGGSTQFILMSKAEIEHRRKRSMAFTRKQSGPWITDPLSMFKKTPTRDLCKWLPASTENLLQVAVGLDEQAEAGLGQNLDMLAPEMLIPQRGAIDRLTEEMQGEEGRPGDDDDM